VTFRSTRSLSYAVCSAALVGLLALSGCSSDPNSIAEQAKTGDQKGYVSGDGSMERIPVAERKDPVSLSGKTIDGGTWAMPTDGKTVVVVNVWGSWCAPCVAEAPHLESVWSKAKEAAKPVQFIGIDFREDPARGQAFASKTGLTYPSLSDESGVLILQLQGKAPTVPTTLVLDKDLRIAARISGPVTESTLSGLIDDVVAES
jgi:thiol-disulfide isomerase/thioredoxin